MTTINGVNVAYTKSGNVYKESTTGKKVGTIAGLAATAGIAAIPFDKIAKVSTTGRVYKFLGVTSLKDLAQKFIKGGVFDGRLNDLSAGLKRGSLGVFTTNGKNVSTSMATTFDKLAKMSKNQRIAGVVVLGGLAAAAMVGVGRCIGGIYDHFVNSNRAKNADKNAIV